MARSKGFRRKTRGLLRKRIGSVQGFTRLLTAYNVADRVVIDIDPSHVKGMPHRRFQGRVGSIKEVRRRSLVVDVPMGGKVKKVIARLEHVKPYLEVSKGNV